MQMRVSLAPNTSSYRISRPPLTRSHSRFSHSSVAFFGASTAGGPTPSAGRKGGTAGLAPALAGRAMNEAKAARPQALAVSRAWLLLVMRMGLLAQGSSGRADSYGVPQPDRRHRYTYVDAGAFARRALSGNGAISPQTAPGGQTL